MGFIFITIYSDIKWYHYGCEVVEPSASRQSKPPVIVMMGGLAVSPAHDKVGPKS